MKYFEAIQVLDRFLRLPKRGQRVCVDCRFVEPEIKPKENLYELPEDCFFHRQTMSSDSKKTKASFMVRFRVHGIAGGAPGSTGRIVATGGGRVRQEGREPGPGWTEFA